MQLIRVQLTYINATSILIFNVCLFVLNMQVKGTFYRHQCILFDLRVQYNTLCLQSYICTVFLTSALLLYFYFITVYSYRANMFQPTHFAKTKKPLDKETMKCVLYNFKTNVIVCFISANVCILFMRHFKTKYNCLVPILSIQYTYTRSYMHG